MKTISQRTFAAVKRVAMNVNPLVTKKNKLMSKIAEMQDEVLLISKEIEGHEMGIKALTDGFTSEDLVTKIVTKLDKTDANGRPLTKTEYVPTELVTFNEEKKVYEIHDPVVDLDDEEPGVMLSVHSNEVVEGDILTVEK